MYTEILSSPATFVIEPRGFLTGQLRVPGDKSISHRAIMLGALAEGITYIKGFLEGEDTLATLEAFRMLGVTIQGPEKGGDIRIHGVGLQGLQAPRVPIYLGNSGTSMRLLAGLFAGQAFNVELVGDTSLSRRPMRRVCDPLTQMGAFIETTYQGTPPLFIHGGRFLHGMEYIMPIASAQVKSSLLLAGLYATGETRIIESTPTRDHTERMLIGFGYPIEQSGASISVQGGGKLYGTAIEVPADISSAAFFIVGALISTGSDILLEHVGINPTRTGVIDILRRMGAEIEVEESGIVGGEPVAAIRVKASKLYGIEIPKELVSLAIDEFPAILLLQLALKVRLR